ncbi:magnesium protoporphyrin IX methyltransferase [Glacieibacterium frigidum]|uniref:Magnesium protoporphyrin IX methyltransferase n=1 Tax=Glacieibacterium frigidum TaxID=2593303 RepID=A0A552U9U6_9SPHN|nr:magnesium protoporphyrin IX methyltransferase [Glacieibacterium frigidum]TRW14996.1 magnesium protoporphyrin IX methyltransferase [Glacieibacterium frigidum]
MSVGATYDAYRGRLETYFDRTAFDAWAKLTSDAPVSGIRATVRAGRDEMRTRLLDWLPADLTGKRILDAGCGTGALAVEAAKRGASVVAVDVSAQLVNLARERLPSELDIDFRAGDMLGDHGEFDHVVAMDSLIHYRFADIVAAAARLQARTRGTLLFTVAPRTPLLLAFQGIGKLFPRSDRSPAIIPASPARLMRDLAQNGWTAGRDARTSTAFYKSHAIEMVRG